MHITRFCLEFYICIIQREILFDYGIEKDAVILTHVKGEIENCIVYTSEKIIKICPGSIEYAKDIIDVP